MNKVIKIFAILSCLFQSAFPQGTIILLNGTSSAGKTSITLELKKLCSDSCVSVNIDEEFLTPLIRLNVQYLQQKTKVKVTNDNYEDIANKLILKKIITQEEIDAFNNKSVKTLYNKMIQKIKDLIREEKNVIFDVVSTEKQEILNWCKEFRKNKVLFVLAYCSFQELAKRVAARNMGESLERRTFSQVWEQFGELYKAAKQGELPILETLSKNTVVGSVKSRTKNEFEKKEEFDEFLSTLLKNLSLDNNITVQITSRYKNDLIVDNSKQSSSAACAKQILEFIKQGHKYTALQENYNKLKPSKSAWQKFWDFVLCRWK